jgi:hypothetical protein
VGTVSVALGMQPLDAPEGRKDHEKTWL